MVKFNGLFMGTAASFPYTVLLTGSEPFPFEGRAMEHRPARGGPLTVIILSDGTLFKDEGIQVVSGLSIMFGGHGGGILLEHMVV